MLQQFNLTPKAAELFNLFFQRADLSLDAGRRIAKESQKKALTPEELEKILLDAMPNSAQVVQLSKSLLNLGDGKCDVPFQTQLIGRPRVRKIEHQVYYDNRYWKPAPPPRDPYEMDLEVDPEARFLIVASGSKFDPESMKPILMKVIARTAQEGEPTDEDKAAIAALCLEDYHQTGALDVMWIGPHDASVTTKDMDEQEFDYGSGAVVISLGKDYVERSRFNAIDPENIHEIKYYRARADDANLPDLNQPVNQSKVDEGRDTTPPQTFDKQIVLSVKAKKEMPPGTWIDDPKSASFFDINLQVRRGWLKEAGTTGKLTLGDVTLETSVMKDDVYYLGSTSAQGKLSDDFLANQTLAKALQIPVKREFSRTLTDYNAVETRLFDMIYGKAKQHVKVAGGALAPLQTYGVALRDTPSITAHKIPKKHDPEKDGATIKLTLDPSFLMGDAECSVKGWRIEVGYKGADDAWVAGSPGPLFVRGHEGLLEPAELELDFPSLKQAREAHRNIEIRVYNAEGVPATRLLIPLEQINWAPNLR